jgi:branched-chain amino acid transport system permease protein
VTGTMKWWVRDLIGLVIVVVILIALSIWLPTLPIAGMAYYFRILMFIGINIILAVSLNIINGHAGQFSLGHAGFMAIGAYLSAVVTYYWAAPWLASLGDHGANAVLQHLLFFLALIFGGLCSAAVGWVVGLPSLRLRGDYLAIVTLGFGEIIRVIFLNVDAVGAARGLSGVPPWTNFFWVFFFVWVTVLVSWRLIRSQIGRAFLAVREDEIAAEAMGVNTTHYKVLAFVVGSFFAGIAGGLFGHYMAYLNPGMFTFILSFEVIVMVVLGGMGSISGAVLAAAMLTFSLEYLRGVKDWFNLQSDPRMVIYAAMLIALMRFRPQGLLGKRELWDFLPRRKDSVFRRGEEGEKKSDVEEGPPID